MALFVFVDNMLFSYRSPQPQYLVSVWHFDFVLFIFLNKFVMTEVILQEARQEPKNKKAVRADDCLFVMYVCVVNVEIVTVILFSSLL